MLICINLPLFTCGITVCFVCVIPFMDIVFCNDKVRLHLFEVRLYTYLFRCGFTRWGLSDVSINCMGFVLISYVTDIHACAITFCPVR